MKYFPPETEEIASRLTQRFDDTEEKVSFVCLGQNSFSSYMCFVISFILSYGSTMSISFLSIIFYWQVKLRLVTYHQNVESVFSTYQDLIYKVKAFLSSVKSLNFKLILINTREGIPHIIHLNTILQVLALWELFMLTNEGKYYLV